jgi:hypothetical protein
VYLESRKHSRLWSSVRKPRPAARRAGCEKQVWCQRMRKIKPRTLSSCRPWVNVNGIETPCWGCHCWSVGVAVESPPSLCLSCASPIADWVQGLALVDNNGKKKEVDRLAAPTALFTLSHARIPRASLGSRWLSFSTSSLAPPASVIYPTEPGPLVDWIPTPLSTVHIATSAGHESPADSTLHCSLSVACGLQLQLSL